LLKELTDADDIAIIVAGYPSEMEVFLESNPGLHSRFVVKYEILLLNQDQEKSCHQKIS